MLSPNHAIIIYDDLEKLLEAAAQHFASSARLAMSSMGYFNVVLSGGATPRPLYEKLASEPFRSHIEWMRVHLFWGDERCVPPTHQDSNYHMVKAALIDQVPIPDENVHRISGELGGEAAAEGYEQELLNFFPARQVPAFDLALLGMGDDGHTASLFPGTAAIHETERWVVGHYVKKLDSWRVTLTPRAFRGSQRIVILIAGEGKADCLREVHQGPFEPDRLPIQSIQSGLGHILWIVDKPAASKLEL